MKTRPDSDSRVRAWFGRAFMLQVEFTVEALSRLSPIPINITEDGYWPTYDRAAPFGAALTKR